MMIRLILAIGLWPMLLLSTVAQAHHPLGGVLPVNMVDGLLSGLGHPVIGYDHLAFVVGVGLLWAINRDWRMPAAFICGTLFGCLVRLTGVEFAAGEFIVLLSVFGIGLWVLLGALGGSHRVVTGLLAAVGLFHGLAYGGTIVGASGLIVIAYLVGTVLVQLFIVGLAYQLASRWREAGSSQTVRSAGAVIMGMGLVLLLEYGESMLLPVSL